MLKGEAASLREADSRGRLSPHLPIETHDEEIACEG